MRYIAMAVVGLIVGILARYFYPGAVHIGWLWSIGLGIGGSYVAGLIGEALRGERRNGRVARGGLLASVLGAMLLIFVFRNVLHLV